MEEIFAFIIISLATFRITRLILLDALLEDFRDWVWKKKPLGTKFGYLFTCHWCMSVWVASLLVVCYTIIPMVTVVVSSIFAVSAVSGLIASRLDS